MYLRVGSIRLNCFLSIYMLTIPFRLVISIPSFLIRFFSKRYGGYLFPSVPLPHSITPYKPDWCELFSPYDHAQCPRSPQNIIDLRGNVSRLSPRLPVYTWPLVVGLFIFVYTTIYNFCSVNVLQQKISITSALVHVNLSGRITI